MASTHMRAAASFFSLMPLTHAEMRDDAKLKCDAELNSFVMHSYAWVCKV